MEIDVTTVAGAHITIDVAYYYFTVDHSGNVTHVNYAYDDPTGPYSQHVGDFTSFQSAHYRYLLIPVPHNATP